MNNTAANSLSALALRATIHCLTGCAIGEVLGMVLGTALGLSNGTTVVLSIALAFVSGFGLTLWPLLGAGLGWGTSLGLAFASDAASITVMEIVDNALMLAIPGAMDAPLTSGLFWGSLTFSLLASGAAAFPLNRWLIARGEGHARVHALHAGHGGHASDPHAGHTGHAGHTPAPIAPAPAPEPRPAGDCCAKPDAHAAHAGHAHAAPGERASCCAR